MQRVNSASAFIDLQQASAADAQIDRALADGHARHLRSELATQLAAADPAGRALALGLIEALARLTAQVAVLQQSVEQSHRSRAERIRIDPLPFIPESRAASAPRPPQSFSIEAGATEFSGSGWFDAETNGTVSWRWSGKEPSATLVLPSLGGGRLRLSLDLQMPFGHRLSDASIALLINDTKLELQGPPAGSRQGRFIAEFSLPEDAGFGTVVLVLQSSLHSDTNATDRRDTRQLGVGLRKLTLERLDGVA